MELREWQYMSKPAGSTSSNANNKSFKKRFDRLVRYYSLHLPARVDYLTIDLLTNDKLEFTAHWSTGDKVEFKIHIVLTSASEAWKLKVSKNGKYTDDLSGEGWIKLLRELRSYMTVPVANTPEYKNLLTEWVVMNNKTSSTGYKKRFEKLIKYHIDHASSELESVIKKDIKEDGFHLGEHYNTGQNEFDRDIIVSVEENIYDKTADIFFINILINGSEVMSVQRKGYENFLEYLYAYLNIPEEGTSEYTNLLVEWVAMKNNSTANDSQAASNIKGQKYRYKKLLAQIDADKICKYVLNELTDTILDITVDTKFRTGINIKIIYKAHVPCYNLQVIGSSFKELNNLTYEDIIDLLQAAGVIDNTDIAHTTNVTEALERIPEKLYHATYKQFLNSIRANGLGKTERKMWSDSRPGVVYLADDPWVAESYAEIAEWLDEITDSEEYLDNIIILEIDTNKLDSSKLRVDENVLLDEGEENSTWEYHGIIPWDACKIFNASSFADDFELYENLWN